MPKFENSRSVRHTPEQMFALVADIERYPDFLPLCQKLVVRSRREKGTKTLLVADMTVAYKLVRETFTSQIFLRPEDRQIDVTYLDGPFRYLENRWNFVEAPDGCEVRFFIDYEFRNRALGLLMGSMFDYAFRRFANAFEDRANLVYANEPVLSGT